MWFYDPGPLCGNPDRSHKHPRLVLRRKGCKKLETDAASKRGVNLSEFAAQKRKDLVMMGTSGFKEP